MNQQQVKYLKERISNIHRNKRYAVDTKIGVPAEVAEAKRIVGRWEKKKRRIIQQRQESLQREYSKAFEAIMLRDPSDAIKALREFERFKP